MPPLCVKRKQIYMLISVSILLLVSKRLFMSHSATAYLQWTPNDDKTPCKHISYLENIIAYMFTSMVREIMECIYLNIKLILKPQIFCIRS